ncbi:hypothetical protein NDU88_003922 [Pleurodeles waltl]|uniref:ribonuclease H n=1 Tax=Pleurodeles waltl TaxID=8319 RepID=A0AAV7TR37_PLEWA|nr:hypothetical protein NDU88_003922 [Pleurodeles waltl]
MSLGQGAIEKVPVPEVGHGCYSRNFLVPKKDKGLRPTLDFRDLNYFLKKEKLKMLTLAQVLSALDPGDRMLVLDLQHTYFHIPILPAHRRYLRFMVGHKHYQFTVLLFSLTSTPRVFMKVMVKVVEHLRRLGVSVFPYLDDWLLKADSPQIVVSRFLDYGEPPVHTEVHHQCAEVTPDSISDAPFHWSCSGHSAVSGLSSRKVSPRYLGYDSDLSASVLGFSETDSEATGPHGLLASCILLVTLARWHMRALQWDLKFQWAQHQGNLSNMVQISEETAKDLQWWLSYPHWVHNR